MSAPLLVLALAAYLVAGVVVTCGIVVLVDGSGTFGTEDLVPLGICVLLWPVFGSIATVVLVVMLLGASVRKTLRLAQRHWR